MRKIYREIKEVPDTERYDRTISIATFEHLDDLQEVVCRAPSLLAKEGVLQVAVPSEGSLLWKLASNLSTGIVFRLTTELSYSVFMRLEHISVRRADRRDVRVFNGRVDIGSFEVQPPRRPRPTPRLRPTPPPRPTLRGRHSD